MKQLSSAVVKQWLISEYIQMRLIEQRKSFQQLQDYLQLSPYTIRNSNNTAYLKMSRLKQMLDFFGDECYIYQGNEKPLISIFGNNNIDSLYDVKVVDFYEWYLKETKERYQMHFNQYCEEMLNQDRTLVYKRAKDFTKVNMFEFAKMLVPLGAQLFIRPKNAGIGNDYFVKIVLSYYNGLIIKKNAITKN